MTGTLEPILVRVPFLTTTKVSAAVVKRDDLLVPLNEPGSRIRHMNRLVWPKIVDDPSSKPPFPFLAGSDTGKRGDSPGCHA